MTAKRLRAAFTLMEIMVVVVIIGALAGFAMPQYHRAVERARSREGFQILQTLHGAQLRHQLENNVYANDINLLDVAIPQPRYFDPPTVSDIGPIARISRPPYILAITADGTITCAASAVWCPVLGCPGVLPAQCAN